MRNRAKCRPCGSIIESMHAQDLVLCNCGQIFVEGGDAMKCGAGNWRDFARVDDEGNEIMVQVAKSAAITLPEAAIRLSPTRFEMLGMLSDMIAGLEALPSRALDSPVTHYDLMSALILIEQIMRSE